MKEKILEILIKNNLPTRHNDTAFGRICAADEIMELINQEVERRIKERMPSEEDISKFLDNCDLETSAERENMYDAIEWLRSRLTKDDNDAD